MSEFVKKSLNSFYTSYFKAFVPEIKATVAYIGNNLFLDHRVSW